MRSSGIFIVGLAATTGISSLPFVMQYDNKSAHQTMTPAIQSTPTAAVSVDSSEATLTVDSRVISADVSADSPPSEATITGEAVINDEVIPLTQGTVERSFTDSSGTEHTVTISLDGQTTVIESNSSQTSIEITSSSNSSGTNTTRGSPRR